MILEGKTIIVTGGASGIGRATCVLAAREGASVAIADINREMAEETARLVEVQGQAALVIEMDTSKKADAQRMVEETVGTFGTIDGIVCSAIKLVPGKLEELPEEDWDMVMDIGLKGYFLCAQAAGRVMLEKGSGSIVFVSSIGGVQAYNGAGAYSVCKAGAIMLGQLIGVEWGGRGVRGNTVCPGQVRTPMTEAMFKDPEIAAGRAAVVPMGRVGEPEEIAEANIFLLSDRASYINADFMQVDGGQAESKMMHTPGRNWGGKKMNYSTSTVPNITNKQKEDG
ncbi:MAG: Dihydroanticapsin 7-dehydrogenase [Alphaproteobacteria bacterium MarineAlpha3_Bin7]|nr:MAG: Dihydroanticapsin 7-dehydrogenase [Alphaproteobacteria bacterium MarineAlpha3_Bin7]|tara:strand:+ start:1027 stop:1875 length:849 start_codon:yes stop_codon:yes gene_type:complete